MKQIAILSEGGSHGKEIIRIFEELGADNPSRLRGKDCGFYYYIDRDRSIHEWTSKKNIEEICTVMTIEEATLLIAESSVQWEDMGPVN